MPYRPCQGEGRVTHGAGGGLSLFIKLAFQPRVICVGMRCIRRGARGTGMTHKNYIAPPLKCSYQISLRQRLIAMYRRNYERQEKQKRPKNWATNWHLHHELLT
jgi:hypothetical protein